MVGQHLLQRRTEIIGGGDAEEDVLDARIFGQGGIDGVIGAAFRTVQAELVRRLAPYVERDLARGVAGIQRPRIEERQDGRIQAEIGAAGQRAGADDEVIADRVRRVGHIDDELRARREACRAGDVVMGVGAGDEIDVDADRALAGHVQRRQGDRPGIGEVERAAIERNGQAAAAGERSRKPGVPARASVSAPPPKSTVPV